MRANFRTLALAFTTSLAFVALMGERPVHAQNTYADVPFNQGSLFYRPSGAKPPVTSNRSSSAPRGPFWRRRANTYAVQPRTYYPPAYRPAAPVYGAPVYPTQQPLIPTARYYTYPAR